jgi:hypothetical protein
MRKDTTASWSHDSARPFSFCSRDWLSDLETTMAEDLENTIRDNASGPASASADGVSVEQHSLPDQIAADKYLAQKQAGRNPAKALTRVKIIPPGTAP